MTCDIRNEIAQSLIKEAEKKQKQYWISDWKEQTGIKNNLRGKISEKEAAWQNWALMFKHYYEILWCGKFRVFN